MVYYLVLHTNGTYTSHNESGALKFKRIQSHLNGGYMTLVPNRWTHATKDNNNTNTTLRGGAVLIADEEGVMKDLPTNSWSFALAALGFSVTWMFGGLKGPLLLVPPENRKGNFAGTLRAVFERYLKAIKAADDGDAEDCDKDRLETLLAHVQEKGTMPATCPDNDKKSKKRKADAPSEDEKKPKKVK